MYVLTQAHSAGWRVWIPALEPNKQSTENHAALKKLSMWHGHDKTEEFAGVMCLGYEFPCMKDALAAIAQLENVLSI